MREGKGQTNKLHFEKSNEKRLSGGSTHVHNSKTSCSKGTSVSADFSQMLQESLSLSLFLALL